MPNWCENELDIKGPLSDRERLRKQVRGTGKVANPDVVDPAEDLVDTLENLREMRDLDFEKIVPTPFELTGETSPLPDASPEKDAERMKKYGAKDWYTWNCKNWGTKWNASDPRSYSDKKETLSYTFNTAWSPPTPIILALAKQFPTLTMTLKYWETGCGFRGILKVKGEKVIKQADYDYHGGRGG